jgi:hypothetical protein
MYLMTHLRRITPLPVKARRTVRSSQPQNIATLGIVRMISEESPLDSAVPSSILI